MAPTARTVRDGERFQLSLTCSAIGACGFLRPVVICRVSPQPCRGGRRLRTLRNSPKLSDSNWPQRGGFCLPAATATDHPILSVADRAYRRISVESRCGAVTVGPNISVFRLFRLAVPYEFARGSVSTPRSSNWTGRSPASSSRTRHHASPTAGRFLARSVMAMYALSADTLPSTTPSW
jgi:hypothetical protein